MCGRFVLTSDANTIQQHFNLDAPPEGVIPRYNIAPTQPVAVITNENPMAMDYFTWGLIPSWSKDPSIGSRMINARGETIHEKPSFRSAFKRRRCLIPANGFYEWTQRSKSKVPMFVHLTNQTLFAMAGLWEVWHGPNGEIIKSCTIITSEPNEVVKPLHNRMAVILHEDDYDLWLSPDELPPDALKPLIRPFEANKMEAYEVSTLVNKPSNDTPECIVPVESPPGQTALM
jgi:putative SOS response-associated peptidase YedK